MQSYFVLFFQKLNIFFIFSGPLLENKHSKEKFWYYIDKDSNAMVCLEGSKKTKPKHFLNI